MSRVIDSSGWRSGDGDAPDPRLIWPDAWRFSREECVRLLAFRERVRRGLVDEDTNAERRLLFYRWAVRVRGLFRG